MYVGVKGEPASLPERVAARRVWPAGQPSFSMSHSTKVMRSH